MIDSDLKVVAVNRRGRQVTCRVRITSLRRSDGTAIGVILLMDAEGAGSGPRA